MKKYQLPHMGGSTISARVRTQLVAELRHGHFSKYDRLPPELELAEHFGVSRSVIRDVLADLEREGFVERGRGIGTRIHRDIVNMTNRLDVKFEYYDLVRGAGCHPSSDNIRVFETPADEQLADHLQLDVGTPLLAIEKRVLASGRPVIFSTDHIPLHLFQSVDYHNLEWNKPVFDLLEEHCGIIVDSDVTRVSATNASPLIRQFLEVPDGEALIFIDEIGYYKLSHPIMQTYAYYTNFFDFTILRKMM